MGCTSWCLFYCCQSSLKEPGVSAHTQMICFCFGILYRQHSSFSISAPLGCFIRPAFLDAHHCHAGGHGDCVYYKAGFGYGQTLPPSAWRRRRERLSDWRLTTLTTLTRSSGRACCWRRRRRRKTSLELMALETAWLGREEERRGETEWHSRCCAGTWMAGVDRTEGAVELPPAQQPEASTASQRENNIARGSDTNTIMMQIIYLSRELCRALTTNVTPP